FLRNSGRKTVHTFPGIALCEQANCSIVKMVESAAPGGNPGGFKQFLATRGAVLVGCDDHARDHLGVLVVKLRFAGPQNFPNHTPQEIQFNG
ncbi:hypothetical protein, partial [Mesorhizobium sp.]|uniref:hypothetical protein n=1 Tax=Mesorhizobium sp. TaxID=1871066 RepID=UPI00257DF78D